MNQLEVLRDLLGTESGNAWIEFMDHISETLSPVLKQGKPSKEVIENSIVGEHGFSSWKQMIEAPVSEGGLGWNVSAWESWKRAYKVVQDYPYLRDIEFGSSKINTIHRETKPSFPASLEALNEYLAEREAAQLERQQNSLKEAQNRSNELQAQLSESNNKCESLQKQIDLLADQLSTAQGEISALSTQKGSLEAHVNTVEKSLSDAMSKVDTLNSKTRSLTDDLKQSKRDLDAKDRELKRIKNRGFFDRLLNR